MNHKWWPAPAKLNLFLYITGRRSDGYHTLQTLFQFIDYSDSLKIIPTFDKKIKLLLTTPSSISDISNNENLIVRAAKLLKHYCWINKNIKNYLGTKIYLNKKLPIGGGLGGGSSNAATTLIVLNQKWRCNLNLETLVKLGLLLGADVPLFIRGISAFSTGIGEIITPFDPIEKWYLITIPPIKISTMQIFSDIELKRNSPHRSLKKLLSIPFYNDCEPIVIKHFPIIEKYILWLRKYAPSRVTGTGSCIFSEFDSEESARKVLSIAPLWIDGIIARGINISPLHKLISKSI